MDDMGVVKGGGPAFPTTNKSGMSLRDWFAGQAMSAYIGRLGPMIRVEGTGTLTLRLAMPGITEEDGRQIINAIVGVAYRYADAMLAARGEQ